MQWRTHVPWNANEQVEQDLIISRALVAIFSDDFLASKLAFRGGTALHKLYLSRSLDIVRILILYKSMQNQLNLLCID
ncbi:Uncharacterised protein [Bacteroides ovatus]|nr:Uncharacterised protein [Bacteroides ovatus]